MNKKVLKNFKCDNMEMDYISLSGAEPELFQKHCHDWYELIFFIDADFEYTVEDKTYNVRSGDAVLIAPGKYHFLKIHGGKRYERAVFSFYPEFTGDALLTEELKFRGEFFSAADYPDFSKELKELISGCVSLSERHTGLFIRASLIRAFLSVIRSPAAPHMPAREDGICSRAVRYISDNLSEISDTDDIAAALFVSKSSLQHAFRKNMDIPVMQYVRIKRLFAARQLISGGKSLRESAEQVGYDEYTTFYRAFKAHFGYPPAIIKNSNTEK